jgi:hypothetical protein
MTELKKNLSRKVVGLLRNPITTILCPNGLIGFREGRSTKTYWIPLMTCYNMAIEANLKSERNRKELARIAKAAEKKGHRK